MNLNTYIQTTILLYLEPNCMGDGLPALSATEKECCTYDKQCHIGQGPCEENASECDEVSTCSKGSCKKHFQGQGFNWHADDSCCMPKSMENVHFYSHRIE